MPWWLWKARMFERIGNRQLGEMKPITSVTPDQYPAILWGFSYLVRQGFAKETIWKEFRPGSAQPGCGVSCMSSMSGKANKSWSYLALGIGITRITCISVSNLGLFRDQPSLVCGFNMTFIFHFIYGMSSFPLTFIFFKMVKTTNQISFLGATRFRPIPNVSDFFYKNIPSERSGAGNKCQSIFRFMFGYLTLHQLIILAHTHRFSTHCTQYVLIVISYTIIAPWNQKKQKHVKKDIRCRFWLFLCPGTDRLGSG